VGWGDELMIAGEARRIHQQCGGKVSILSRLGGKALSSPLWRRISYIAQPGEPAISSIIDSPEHRPYRAAFDALGSIWREYRPLPAEISFSDAELQFAEPFGSGFVVIEPHIKAGRDGGDNKQWGWQRYSKLVALRPEERWIQLSQPEKPTLPGVTHVRTKSFRQACAVLARAAAYVGPEGGFHHASAAVGIPAVVIFGGYISPKVTGYEGHINLFSGNGLGCGRNAKCECSCMERISPEEVADALTKILLGRARYLASTQGRNSRPPLGHG
jgi:hypothetical protein